MQWWGGCSQAIYISIYISICGYGAIAPFWKLPYSTDRKVKELFQRFYVDMHYLFILPTIVRFHTVKSTPGSLAYRSGVWIDSSWEQRTVSMKSWIISVSLPCNPEHSSCSQSACSISSHSEGCNPVADKALRGAQAGLNDPGVTLVTLRVNFGSVTFNSM